MQIEKTENPNITNRAINGQEIQKTISKTSENLSDSFEKNSVGQILKGEDNPDNKTKSLRLVPALLIADNLLDASFSGQGNKSLLKKIANIGDVISQKLKLDSVLSEKSSLRVKNFLKNNRFLKYFTSEYSAVPKSPLARTSKMSEKYISDLTSVLSRAAQSERFAEISSAISKETEATLKDIADSKTISAEKLIKAADELISNGIDKLNNGGLLFKSQSLSGSKNKLMASISKIGKTSVGNVAAKGFLKAKDVITYGGGLLSLYFMAGAIVNAVNAAKEAPKGEKKSTFMHVLSEQYLGFILLQPSVSSVYKLAGNKYRGMSVEGREALKNLVKSTNANESLTKAGLKIAKLQRKLLLKGVDKDKVEQLAGNTLKDAKKLYKGLKKQGTKLKLWEKPLKFAGNILSAGLDKLKRPKVLNILGKKIRVPKPTLTGFAGGFARFALIMFVIQPLIQKPITKLVHKIFGKPKTYLAKQEAKNKSDKKSESNAVNNSNPNSNTNLLTSWVDKINTDDVPSAEVNNQQNANNVNINNKMPVDTSNTDAQPLPSLNLVNNDKNNDNNDNDRYIPTVEAPLEQDVSKEVNLKVQNILKNTDKIYKDAKKLI